MFKIVNVLANTNMFMHVSFGCMPFSIALTVAALESDAGLQIVCLAPMCQKSFFLQEENPFTPYFDG